MKSKTPRPKARAKSKPLPVPLLSRFDSSNWTSIVKAFDSAPELQLKQTWLKKNQKNYLPATVRVGWRDNALQILAEISDKDIYSNAKAKNENLWCLGDVFEIFIRDTSRKPYYEFHVSPNNHCMQLEFPSQEYFFNTKFILNELKVATPLFRFKVQIKRQANLWRIYAKVPGKRICGKTVSLKGRTWLFSFCRYDYTRKEKDAVLSSTSSYRGRNFSFHLQKYWLPLQFA